MDQIKYTREQWMIDAASALAEAHQAKYEEDIEHWNAWAESLADMFFCDPDRRWTPEEAVWEDLSNL